jgi:nicotinamidase-related amidase
MQQRPRSALIVIDPQRAFCDADGSMAKQGRPIETMRHAAVECERLAQLVRASCELVVWTRMVFAPDYCDGGELIRSIRPNLARIGALRRGSGDELFSAVVNPHPDDTIIDKTRYSALVGTDLEARFKDAGIQRVFLCGVTTSMCVESTARDLGQRDFETFVISDACADFDAARHVASLAAIAFGFARLLTVAEAIELLNGK